MVVHGVISSGAASQFFVVSSHFVKWGIFLLSIGFEKGALVLFQNSFLLLQNSPLMRVLLILGRVIMA